MSDFTVVLTLTWMATGVLTMVVDMPQSWVQVSAPWVMW